MVYGCPVFFGHSEDQPQRIFVVYGLNGTVWETVWIFDFGFWMRPWIVEFTNKSDIVEALVKRKIAVFNFLTSLILIQVIEVYVILTI